MPTRYTDDELSELGIVRTATKGQGRENTVAYVYRCASCGRATQRVQLILSRPIYCGLCKTDALRKISAAKKIAEENELFLNSLGPEDANKKLRFQKAAAFMQKQGDYAEAIARAECGYDKYGSIPEAIAAIVLLQAGFRVIAQQPVSDYKIDFLLPDAKIAIEIDGGIYHKDVARREMRDLCIKHNLGVGWVVLHVPAEDLAKKPKRFEALIKAKVNKALAQDAGTI